MCHLHLLYCIIKNAVARKGVFPLLWAFCVISESVKLKLFSNVHINESNFDCYYRGEPVQIVASVSCSELSFTVVAHWLHGSTYCAFSDALLHILVERSGYFSYPAFLSTQSRLAISSGYFYSLNCLSLDIIYLFLDGSLRQVHLVPTTTPH